jgi:pseudouridine-5'-phosphate glycosidase
MVIDVSKSLPLQGQKRERKEQGQRRDSILLKRNKELIGGLSLTGNLHLAKNNAAVGAHIAAGLVR